MRDIINTAVQCNLTLTKLVSIVSFFFSITNSCSIMVQFILVKSINMLHVNEKKSDITISQRHSFVTEGKGR